MDLTPKEIRAVKATKQWVQFQSGLSYCRMPVLRWAIKRGGKILL
jgi:hypothetical protein